MEASIATSVATHAISVPEKQSRPFAGIGQHISHSQVGLFDKCQLSWFVKYIKGITKPPTVPMLLGQCYHEALAHNFNHKLITGVDLPVEDVIRAYNIAFQQSVGNGRRPMSWRTSRRRLMQCSMGLTSLLSSTSAFVPTRTRLSR